MCTNKKYDIIVGEYDKNHYIKPLKKNIKMYGYNLILVEIIPPQIYKYFEKFYCFKDIWNWVKIYCKMWI